MRLANPAAHSNRGHAARRAAQAATTCTARLSVVIGERDALLDELDHLTNQALTLPA